jgi:hypothetical protein
MHKRALITGITGQDGSYLADLLLKNDPKPWRPDPARLREVFRQYRAGAVISQRPSSSASLCAITATRPSGCSASWTRPACTTSARSSSPSSATYGTPDKILSPEDAPQRSVNATETSCPWPFRTEFPNNGSLVMFLAWIGGV